MKKKQKKIRFSWGIQFYSGCKRLFGISHEMRERERGYAHGERHC